MSLCSREHTHTRARARKHTFTHVHVSNYLPTQLLYLLLIVSSQTTPSDQRKGREAASNITRRVSFLPPIFSLRYLASLILYCCCCQGFLMRGVWSRAASAEATCSDFIYTSVLLNFIHFIISDVCYLNSFYPRYSLRKLFLFQLFVT